MVNYARRYPTAARYLCRKMGYQDDSSDGEYRLVGKEAIPFIALRQTVM